MPIDPNEAKSPVQTRLQSLRTREGERKAQELEPGERRPRGPRRSSASFPILPLLLVLVMVGAVYFLGLLLARNPSSSPPPEDRGYTPFSSVPDEAPPDISGRKGMKWVRNAPPGLADTSAAFAAARLLAAQGEQHLDAARAADAAGNSTEARSLRKQAKEAYDTAFTDTAGWEMELVKAWSDKDIQVRDIQRERTRWMDRIIALHKTTGR